MKKPDYRETEMVKNTLLLLIGLLLIPAAQATTIGGVNLSDSVTVDNHELRLNGAGIRKKFFLKLYVASLYLGQASHDAREIVSADSPMAIQLDITSGMITPKRMEKATIEGFSAATGGKLEPIAERIDQFLDVFRAGVEAGDRFLLAYLPGTGVVVSKNGKTQTTIEGLDFKKALFGIWLSEKPVQKDLKKAMLGNPDR